MNLLDDSLVYSGDIEDDLSEDELMDLHASHIDAFFGRCRTMGISFSIKKAAIQKKYVTYLGLTIGDGKVWASEKTKTSLDKIREIFRVNESDKTWMSIFGSFNYSAHFIPDFAAERAELVKLRKKFLEEKEGLRGEKVTKLVTLYQPRFDEIYKKWSSHVLKSRLLVPKKGGTLNLYCDASDYSLGFNLYDEKHQIVEFGGKKIKPEEKNYPIHEKEMSAILAGVQKYASYICRAKKTIVHTDSELALGYLTRQSECTGRSLRLLSRIMQYPRLEFVRVHTSKNNSDLESRLVWEDDLVTPQNSVNISTPGEKFEEKQVYLSDQGQLESPEVIDAVTLLVHDSIIENLDIPSVILALHAIYNHCSAKRLQKLIKLAFGIHFSVYKIDKIVQECADCLESKREVPKNTITKKRIASRPLEIVSLDHFTWSKIPDSNGFCSILTIKCEHSKHICAIPVKTYSIQEVLHYINVYIMMLGKMDHLHCDNFFKSKEFIDFCEEQGITYSFNPAWCPKTCQVERVHKDFRRIFPIVLRNSGIPDHQWSEAAYAVASTLNLTPTQSHGYPPMLLMRGCLQADIYLDFQCKKSLEELHKEVFKKLTENRDKQLHLPGKNKGVNKPLKEGTKIRVFLGQNADKPQDAIVILDNGITCTIQKLDKKGNFVKGRYGIIVVHKERIRKVPKL